MWENSGDALQQAAINLGLSQEQRRNIDEACRAVEIRPAAFITIYGGDSSPLLRFTNAGDLLLLEDAEVYT